jgi:hypothetical protein
MNSTGKPIQWLYYNISVTTYTKSGNVTPAGPLNAWTVKNNGTNPVEVNGDPLDPGESKSVGGNYGEVYIGMIKLNFGTGAAAGNNAEVTQKFYCEGAMYDTPPKAY